MDLIVNVAENWGIGKDGKLLVSISADLRRFRQLTTGKAVILGRKTLQTFPGGRPLKNRTNLILSGSGIAVEGAEVFPNLETLKTRLKTLAPDRISVIGGASVYRLLLPYCEKAYVTRTLKDFPADTFFPNLDEMENWTLEQAGQTQWEGDTPFQYVDYINRSPLPL